MLLFAGCLEPQLALADANGARSELATARSEPMLSEPARSGMAPAEPPRAEALELRVSYRAPRECPSSSDFLDALRRHVAAGGAGAIDADVRITRASGAEFALVLRLRVAGKASETSARDESCLALMQLAALNTSMARTARPPERTALAAPPPPFAIEPSPSLEVSAPVEASAAEGPGLEAAAATPRQTRTRGRGLRAFVLGEARTVSGMLPRLAWGQGIGAGVARDFLSLRLSATFWQGQHGVFAPDGSSPIHLDFEQRSLALAPCAGRALLAVLRVDGCALFGAHRIGTNAQGARTYGSVGAAALATLSPWRGMRVELEGGLSAAFRRPSFAGDLVRDLYAPELIQPSARIGLGWDFGGGL